MDINHKPETKHNPTMPAGPQVGQTINGNLDFPPDFGVDSKPIGSREGLKHRHESSGHQASEPGHRERNLESENSIRGLDTPEGLGE